MIKKFTISEVKNGTLIKTHSDTRYIGLMTEPECKATLNSEDAVKKIHTSESGDPINDIDKCKPKGKRFVAVLSYDKKSVFISPLISRSLQLPSSTVVFECEDGVSYRLKEVQETEG